MNCWHPHWLNEQQNAEATGLGSENHHNFAQQYQGTEGKTEWPGSGNPNRRTGTGQQNQAKNHNGL